MIRDLRRSYASRSGVPVARSVDEAIFSERYFAYCMNCTYCGDSCCSHGCDVDAENVERLLAAADRLEPYVRASATTWFPLDEYPDPEVPGGRTRRTRVENGACIFLNREGRGCRIHRFCLERGVDYHSLKPAVCSLFPITWEDGLLRPSDEFRLRDLACLDDGPTVYQGARDEVRFYFGPELVAELDEMEAIANLPSPARPPRRPPTRRLGT